jgi:hypothetical protein
MSMPTILFVFQYARFDGPDFGALRPLTLPRSSF